MDMYCIKYIYIWFTSNCQSTVPGGDTQHFGPTNNLHPPTLIIHLWPWSIIGVSFPFAIERTGLLCAAYSELRPDCNVVTTNGNRPHKTQLGFIGNTLWLQKILASDWGFLRDSWSPPTHELYGKLTKFESRSYSRYMSSLALHRLIMLQQSIGPSKMIVSCSSIWPFDAICSLNGRLREQAEIPRPLSSGCALISSYPETFGHGPPSKLFI